ncbi:MAG: HAD family phosphatase [Spirochaetes bacterium]|nr:HAD family phosphatase [Spirochaetota bacterium]
MQGERTLLIFDAGGVLYTFDHERMWLHLEEATKRSRGYIKSILYGENFVCFERGMMSAEQYYTAVSERLELNLSFDEFTRVFNSFLIKRDCMFSLLARLVSRIRLHILSNTNEINAVRIRRDLSGIPAGMTFSHETGFLKPEPEIYGIALDNAGSAPSDALFIDDFIENVSAAESVGIRSHRFDGLRGLLRFLEAEGIETAPA